MFQQSLVSSPSFPESAYPVSFSPEDSEELDELVPQPSPRQALGAQTANGINRAQIIADAQTPILDRFPPDSVIPLPELFAVYEAVDQRLAMLLKRITTATEVACAFATESYACYSNAARVIGETILLQKVAQNLRSLGPVTALYQLAQLPPFFQEKVWAQFSLQEQQQFAKVSQQIQGGRR